MEANATYRARPKEIGAAKANQMFRGLPFLLTCLVKAVSPLIMIGRPLAIAWSLLAVAPLLFAGDPFVGTWKLTKSKQKDHQLGSILRILDLGR